MSIAETIKYIGRRRSDDNVTRKRLNISRPLLQGTPPRKKTVRRMKKQANIGLSFLHKEAFVRTKEHPGHGVIRHPTKGTVYGLGIKTEHPDPEAAKINAPFYGVVRVPTPGEQLPREARKTKDQKRQRRVG